MKAASVLIACAAFYVLFLMAICFGTYASLFDMFASRMLTSLFEATVADPLGTHKVAWAVRSFVDSMTIMSSPLLVISAITLL